MSRYSGVCDFYDHLEIFGLSSVLNSKVYVGKSKEPLRLTCLKDCIPYYPYVISVSAWDKESDSGYIRLTEKSWLDIEEERYGHTRMHDVFREELKKEIERYEKENGK